MDGWRILFENFYIFWDTMSNKLVAKKVIKKYETYDSRWKYENNYYSSSTKILLKNFIYQAKQATLKYNTQFDISTT